ncbi:MAG: glycosyltransferase family 1 protein [Candidatus Spechtbacterales bacterium]|nr:glycosyltransferase family 1 protein [Candidatus Spechtbacterales bacterium]
MKIGIDIRALEGSEYGGVAEYIKNILPEMFSIAPEHSFYIFCSSYRHKVNLEKFNLPNVEILEFRYPNKLFNFFSRYLNFPKVDKIMGGLDIFFSPHFLPVALSENCLRVTTFHDLSFELFPHFFDRKRRLWHKYIKPKKQAELSDAIIAVSESTKSDLEDLYDIDTEKIQVVYSGITTPPAEKNKWSNIRKKYKLPHEYILSLSTIEPRKNIRSTLRAFRHIASKKEFSHIRLVIAGSLGWSYKDIFAEIKNIPEIKNKIIFTGPIDEKDKFEIYKNATIFVYPSLYEGFGFPPLEAMSQGVPAVVSFSTSLPEVTGGAALLVDPTRPIEIADAIEELITDSRLYNKFSEDGKKQATNFTWAKAAQETLRVFENIST